MLVTLKQKHWNEIVKPKYTFDLYKKTSNIMKI